MAGLARLRGRLSLSTLLSPATAGRGWLKVTSPFPDFGELSRAADLPHVWDNLYTSLDRFFALLKSTKRICSQDVCTAPDRYRGTAYERLTKDRQRADPRQLVLL